jgi:hypothetical protein
MPMQQLSYGGATAPIDTSVGGDSGGLAPTVTTITNVPTSLPGSEYYQGSDITSLQSLGLDPYGNSSVAAEDPFNMRSEAPGNPAGAYNEAASPGYQKYGNDWLNLLQTLNSPPPSATINVEGQNITVPQSLAAIYNKDPSTQVPLGIVNGQFESKGLNNLLYDQAAGSLGVADSQALNAFESGGGSGVGGVQGPLSVQNLLEGGGSNLSNQVFNLYNDSKGTDTAGIYDLAAPQVAADLGLTPGSQEAQNYTDAYVTDVLQNASQNSFKDYQQVSSRSAWSTALEDVVKAAAYFAAGGGVEGIAESAAGTAAGAGGDAASGTEAAATTAGETADDLALFRDAQTGLQGLSSAANHDPFGAAGALVSGLGGATGLTGANSTVSKDITSGIADTLGVSPDTIGTGLDILSSGAKAANIAVPIIQNAAAPAGTALPNSATSGAPPPPAAAPTPAPLTLDAAGDPLTPDTVDNSAQGAYAAPKTTSYTLGGGLGAESGGGNSGALQRMLQELGQS